MNICMRVDVSVFVWATTLEADPGHHKTKYQASYNPKHKILNASKASAGAALSAASAAGGAPAILLGDGFLGLRLDCF